MTCVPSRKRQESDDHLDQPQRPLKRAKTGTSAYWDSLSKIWLTRDALEELDRRNRAASSSVKRSSYSHHRPFTRQLQASLRRRCQTLAPDPLISCKPESQSKIKRLSRRGGPDLSDLRNFPDPHIPFYQSMSANSSRSQSRKRRGDAPPESSNNKTAKTTSTTPYNRNFEQKLIDYGVYFPGYKYPGGQKPAKPNNWSELNERLARPRASLSPSRFSDREFEEFVDADLNASKEKPIVRYAVPIIEGRADDIRCVGGDYPFGNLAPLTDGSLANAKPDHFIGARPEQLDPKIRDSLNKYIQPSTQSSLPIAPNFFLEAKGPDGPPIVATRQACYDGTLGARGMHKLQSYKQEPVYDNNAYTITSTYLASNLKLYTIHPTPRESDGRPEYIMTQLNGWCMTGDLETFRKGATAYRNARDWAKEQRDKFINAANERHNQPQSENEATSELLSSEHEATSGATVTLEDPDTSAMSDEAEFHDAAQWSFARPNDSFGDAQASDEHAKGATAEPTDSTSRKSLPN
ncbi:hypothetical protein MferCBS31731_005667 [Microsporum ferrugineum]